MCDLLRLGVVFSFLLLPQTSQAFAQERQPWSVPSDMPVVRRAITFGNRGATSSGTLFYAAGDRPRATVIALHGAGAPLRSEPLYRHLTSGRR